MKKIQSLACTSLALFLFLFIPFASSHAQGTAGQKKTVRIGMIFSLTGVFSAALRDVADATKPMADVINQRGGITVNGQKHLVELIIADDQSSPTGAVAALNKLMQDHIDFVIPPFFVPSIFALLPMLKDARVVTMKPYLTIKELVSPDLPRSFAASTYFYNPPIAYDYLTKHYPKAKRVAIIAPDDPGMIGWFKMVQGEIQKRGLELVFDERFKMGSEDYYPLLTRALQKKPDVIDLVASIEPWSAGIINQSRELGFKGPMFTSTAMFGDINLVNGMINRAYAYDLFQPEPDPLSPKMPALVKELRTAVEQKTGKPLISPTVAAFDAVYVLCQGIQKAQSFDVDKVTQALEGMKSIETVYGKGRMAGADVFGINHVVRRPIALSGISDGKVWCSFTDRD
jgi:branched-chain amino acid transport system substrate-binding protein